MFFTREDILKIQQALLQLGVKDSELPSAEPVTYDDTLSIVQDGKNKQIKIEDFFNQISLWKREDFINITDRYDEHYIMLLEAINLVPILQRKDGLVITFQDTNGNWRIYQFRGNITEFLNEEKWFDLYDYRNYIIQSIVPDEEDLTASTPDENGNSLVHLKDRVYNPTIFSGKGYRFVRKNIINVELATIKISIINPTTLEGDIYFNINNKGTKVHLSPTIHNTTKLVAEAIKDTLTTTYTDYEVTIVNSVVTLTRKYSGNTSSTTFEMYNTGVIVIVEDYTTISERNIITQEDINKADTIYEIRYNFDLNGKTITIPNNCVLYFTSGKFYNGSINMYNTVISTLYEDILSEVNINGNYYNIQEHIKNHQRQLDDKQSQIDNKQQQINANDKDISLLQTRSNQMEETIKSIAATGGASQATAVTYNNEKSKLTAINIQSAVDEVVEKTSIKDEEGVVVETPFHYIQNDEYIIAVVDAENRILAGIKYDGEPYFPNHEMYSVITNDEWLYATIDAENKVLGGFRANDGHMIVGGIDISTFITNAIIDVADIKERTAHLSTIVNDEYLSVETDADGKVIGYTASDGSHYLYKVKSETIPTEFEHIEDPEGRTEITTDADGKVLAYRDSEGTMHENSFATKTLTINGTEYQETLNQYKRESIDAINNLELSEINGIEDHGKENLYTGYTKRYTTADGKQTFISPNESFGAVFCNPIRCSAGEFFTRTGIATAIVVVSDKNDNNAQRLYQPSGAFPGNTFQIPETWDWAYYLRCVCMSTDKELAIMRGKYAIKKSEQDGKLRIPEMKLSIANFTKETKYISSPNGKMYEIAVDNDGQLYAKEIDKDVIFPSDIPSKFKFTLVNNLSKGEKLPFDRFITNIDSYVGIWNANGVCAYKDLSPARFNANWEYHKNSKGEGRYMCVNGYDAEGFPKGFSVYNEQFELVDNVVGKFDNHDYIYIDDGHYILFNETIHQITIDGKEYTPKIPTIYEYKNGEVIAQRLLDDQIIMNDLAPTDYFRSETHVNTLRFDGEDETRIIINPRHCMSFFILERKISVDGSVTFGNIVAQIGGLHTSNHYDVDSRIKTEDKCQWFLCHDVKKWGTKNINGKSYPVYTLFDNNSHDTLNVNNTSGGQPSRIVQMAIDFENKKIVEYKIYQIEEYKSDIMSSAFMFDEGKIFINYARQPICGYYDFTTDATVVSENTYTGAVKKLEFHSGTNTPYRVNPFNV